MAPDRRSAAVWAVPAGAALLLWPAVWNGYPIVFADTGTYLSQAIHRYAGWDRPVFYSVFMLPLHLTLTVWPVVVVQALLTAWVLWVVCRVLVPGVSGAAFVGGVGLLSACTWLPWIVSELMPDVFTPLLVLVLCLLGWVPERLARWERIVLIGLAAFMIASQLSSLPLSVLLGAVILGTGMLGRKGFSPRRTQADHVRGMEADSSLVLAEQRRRAECSVVLADGGRPGGRPLGILRAERRWCLLVLPPALAVAALCAVNLAAHGRFAVAPFGNVFLLARVIYDGPGAAALRRDCQVRHWRLCPFLGVFPPTSDDFLWGPDSPLRRAGGVRAVSAEAGEIIAAGVTADPGGMARAAFDNTLTQLGRFASSDGLKPWPAEVSGWIGRDFPVREVAAYAAARQQRGVLSVPVMLAWAHWVAGLSGAAACVVLLPVALRRGAGCAGFLLVVLLALPVSAAITGALSAPHDRYQSRIMWLPPFIAAVASGSLRRRTA